MKVNEIIAEAKSNKLRKGITQAISNLTTWPDMNTSTGSAYMNYRFGIAAACAPEVQMPAEDPTGGDPVTVTYTDEEADMLNAAAKMVGSRAGVNHSKRGSAELETTNKTSPVAGRKKNKYGV